MDNLAPEQERDARVRRGCPAPAPHTHTQSDRLVWGGLPLPAHRLCPRHLPACLGVWLCSQESGPRAGQAGSQREPAWQACRGFIPTRSSRDWTGMLLLALTSFSWSPGWKQPPPPPDHRTRSAGAGPRGHLGSCDPGVGGGQNSRRPQSLHISPASFPSCPCLPLVGCELSCGDLGGSSLSRVPSHQPELWGKPALCPTWSPPMTGSQAPARVTLPSLTSPGAGGWGRPSRIRWVAEGGRRNPQEKIGVR